jgi:hypothetical protein
LATTTTLTRSSTRRGEQRRGAQGWSCRFTSKQSHGHILAAAAAAARLTSRSPRAVAAAVEDFVELNAACVDVIGLCNYQFVLLKVC